MRKCFQLEMDCEMHYNALMLGYVKCQGVQCRIVCAQWNKISISQTEKDSSDIMTNILSDPPIVPIGYVAQSYFFKGETT